MITILIIIGGLSLFVGIKLWERKRGESIIAKATVNNPEGLHNAILWLLNKYGPISIYQIAVELRLGSDESLEAIKLQLQALEKGGRVKQVQPKDLFKGSTIPPKDWWPWKLIY